eukprot:Skav234536  [mRNA]  locus=scaffold2556:180322:183912:- [translate_table: standard]
MRKRSQLDVPEITVVGSGGVDFDEVLLPLVGPELWRLDVPDARRARAWVRGWVEFNYCRGANQNSSAMRRAGLKTPVEVGSRMAPPMVGGRDPERAGASERLAWDIGRDWQLSEKMRAES